MAGRLACRSAAPWGGACGRCAAILPDGRIARVIFCVHEGRMMLLHGFIKKTQKAPPQEIELALRRKREVER